MKSKKIKKIAIIATLTAIAVIISIVDKVISSIAFPFLPMAKIGLANVVILIGIYKFKFIDSFVIAILKSVISGLIFGSIMSFLIGVSGTIISFFGMWITKKVIEKKVSVIGVSVLGGALHIIGQCIVIYFVYELGGVITLYMGWLILVSLITSILVGVVSKKNIEYKISQF